MWALSNHKFAKKAVIEIELSTGVMLHVTPITNATIRMMREKAKEVYPNPDTRPFMKPVENALNPTEVFLDTDNKHYMALRNIALSAQLDWVDKELIILCCSSPQRDELVALYGNEIVKLAEYSDQPLEEIDQWGMVLTNFLIAHPDDRKLVNDAIKWRLPVTEEEVTEQVIYFRSKVELPERVGIDADSRSVPPEEGDDHE